MTLTFFYLLLLVFSLAYRMRALFAPASGCIH